jgi:hypothetical protein
MEDMSLIQIHSHLRKRDGSRYSTRDGACRIADLDDDWIKRRSARARIGRIDLAPNGFDRQGQINCCSEGKENSYGICR